MKILTHTILIILIEPPIQWLIGVLLFSYGMEKRRHWKLYYGISVIIQIGILAQLVLWHIRTNETFMLRGFGFTISFMVLNFITLCAMGKCGVREILLRLVGVQALQNILWHLYDYIITALGQQRSAGLMLGVMFTLLVLLYSGCFFLLRNELRQNLDPRNLPVVLVAVLALYLKDFLADTPYTGFSDIVIDLLAFGIMFDLFKERKLSRQLETMEQILANEHKQHELVKEEIDIINRKCHDLKHQLVLLKDHGGDLNEFAAEAEQALRIYDSTIKTGNEVLDVVLMEKKLYCEKYKIDLAFLVNGKELSFMKAGDVASLFGNALENAIEYVKTLPEGKRSIRLRIARNGGFVCIHCENPFEGKLIMQDGLPKTSKADHENHGFGMLSISYIVKQYKGVCSVQQQDGRFILNIIIPVA